MRLLNRSYFSLKFRTKTFTRLFAIKQQIQKQHGLCKRHFAETNELRHDMMTFAEYEIKGAPEGDPEVSNVRIVALLILNVCVHYSQVCFIHYDFKPEHNPLVLATEKN
ncbi:hypothetical protein GN244_ATG05305 [Phytophthora infestans]|uniref:Uncharacterized protein n=1 Tax=Phytophthora infestans TaxID=4787 RepID=A0A833WYE3_PHYIN|nr:hypothetical protein GN244_ATG05305 [Phytophthora infestans]